ncbi:oxygen-independent coproporphyrinogen III oxidase [Ardenticatena maritima]|uniref:Coproporphyrinogen-III oxidase n=1 Tax=Ardenticatena maritima TaxID=872965 RepID=A0A0M9UE15_9CHLR|nr:radical SAM family heme chaperone HemW [Ardenticatena maritima]GAP64567.1 oxygen-independent coproporphyrinogen III oxidase [Ardenticatena maritima]
MPISDTASLQSNNVSYAPAWEAHPPPLGIYIHIPFCAARCIYCDFNTYIDLDHLKTGYVDAAQREIEMVGGALNRPPAQTIFFGGGTPTALAPEHLARLIDACRRVFDLSPTAEITVEANPGSVSAEGLRALRAAGVNRLSFGVQSFDDATLRFLGRIHSADEARQAVDEARRAGFDNINLDLIYGLPRQSLAEWQATLEAALALEPAHLSLYALIVEPGTPLQRSIERGDIPPPDDDEAAAQYEWTLERLARAGYTQYEISNWALAQPGDDRTPRLASQHNLIYWRNQFYVGIGAGAHSYVRGVRYANVRHPQTYMRAVMREQTPDDLPAPALDPATRDPIDVALAQSEQMMLGLRLVREGVSAAQFAQRFGATLEARFGATIDALLARGLLMWDGDRLHLTRRGLLLANQVMAAFLPD